MSFQTLAQPAFGRQEQNSTHKFLEFLFAGHKKGFVEFRYFTKGIPPKINDDPDFFPLPLDRQIIDRQVLSRSGRQMVAFGPAPRMKPSEKRKAGADSDVSEISCIWADLDYDKTPGGVIEVVRRVHGLSLRPSIVINSGFGRHIYYAFNEPLHDVQLLDWQEMIIALRDVLGGDAVINASRVMRLPGTLNVKYEPPVETEICADDSSWTKYSLAEVKNFLYNEPKIINGSKSTGNGKKAGASANGNHHSTAAASTKDSGSNSITVSSPTIDALRERGVSGKVIEAVITGKHAVRTGGNAGRDDDQSSRDFWIATSLLEKKFTEEEVKAVFRSHPSGCGSKWANPKHGEKYLETTVAKAAARVAAKQEEKEEKGVGFSDESMPDNYELARDGSIWLVGPPVKKDGEPRMTLVCDSPIRISEILENIDTGQISVSISYKYLNRQRSTTILRGQMCDSRALVAALAGEGAPLTSNNSRLVVSYLTAYEHAFFDSIPHKRVTSKFGRGRGNNTFFLPGLGGDIEFQPVGPGDNAIYRAYASRKGTLKNWVDVMNALVDNNFIIPQIAVCTAFVPPLQRYLQIPNFILDIYGNTSSGKSTALKLAASVFGRPLDPESVIHQWNNTKVSVEQIAGMCNELPVFLDDAQHCADDLKRTVIYMIANGKGKGRGAKGGGLRETMTWQTVALSTSEEPLHEASPHEGARGRLLPIGGLTPPFPPKSGTLVQKLEAAVADNHGLAGDAFVRHINGWDEARWMEWQRRYTHLRAELLKSTESDIVGRVSSYIAAIALAAEAAGPLLGLRFKADVLSAWMINHLNEQQQNQNLILLALRTLADHYIANQNLFAGTDRYDPTRGNLQGASKQGDYVGFLRSTLDAVFNKRKWNQTAILNKMAESGVLVSTEADRHTKKVSVEGVKHRMICLKWSALLPDDSSMYAADS